MPYRVRDLLEHWRAQGAITPAQFDAGRHFLRLYASTIDGRAMIDPERIRVDGGLGHGPAAERLMMSRAELAEIERMIGRFDYALLCRIVGMGRDLKDDPEISDVDRKYQARRVRDALAVIANHDRIAAIGA